jgi:hypothetical protein
MAGPIATPGPETDMRSSAPSQPSSREPRPYPNDINTPHDFECCRSHYAGGGWRSSPSTARPVAALCAKVVVRASSTHRTR